MADQPSLVRLEGKLADELGSFFLEELVEKLSRRSAMNVMIQIEGPSNHHYRNLYAHIDGETLRDKLS